MFRRAVLLILLAVPFAAAKQEFQDTHSETHAFRAGNMLHIQWRVGDLRIVKGTDANNIHIRYTIHSNRESNLQEAKVEFRSNDNDMTIQSHSPYRGNTSIDADIEVPDPTGLDVDLKVGDLDVEGITGDKTLGVGVGDLRVAVGDSPDYRLVRAKTGIGDVDWSPKATQTQGFRETGWLGHKLSYKSNGKYELVAHVGVGDIDLH
jgi:hypothetical protein